MIVSSLFRTFFAPLLITATLFLFSPLAIASSETVHGASPSLLTYLLDSNLFNCLLVAGLLFWLANKFKLLESLQKQPRQISATLLDSETLLGNLAEKKSQLKKELAQLNQVRQDELLKAEQMASVMVATLQEKALAEQKRLQEAERREQERLSQIKAQALVSSLANELLASTRERLLQGLDATQHRRLVEAAIAQVEA